MGTPGRGPDLYRMPTFIHVPDDAAREFDGVLLLPVGARVTWGDGRRFRVAEVALSFGHDDPQEDEGYHVYLEPVDGPTGQM